MTTIRVTFSDGQILIADTDDTPAEIRAHFMGRSFTDLGIKAVRIDCIDPISETPCVNGRIA